jgi:hypothetical protein
MNPRRVIFVCLLVLFIAGFSPRLVYDRVVESYRIASESLQKGRQIAGLRAQLESCTITDRGSERCIELNERLMRMEWGHNDPYDLITVLVSIFLPVEVDRSIRYMYVCLIFGILISFFKTDHHDAQKKQQRKGLRIRPAQKSEIPALLATLEAMDPDWQKNSGRFLRSLMDELRGPISGEIFRFPVAAPTGSLYERDFLQEWFRTRGQTIDPLTNQFINREGMVGHVPAVARLIEKILREALREAEARRAENADLDQVQFEVRLVPARDHPGFGRFIRDNDRAALEQALRRNGLTEQQKRQLIQSLDEPERPVRVRKIKNHS